MGPFKRKPRIPVTVITGFLGSGKTTLLNHILKSNEHGMRFAVIENEVGAIGVDDQLLLGTTPQLVDEEIIEVMNGCICCTVRGDLVSTLEKLYERVDKFDGLIIETTGIADPAPVAQTFFVNNVLMHKYYLDAIITVVDAVHISERLSDPKLTGREDGVINESVEQVAFADKIILNKTDLITDETTLTDIEKQVKNINSGAIVLRTSYSKIDPKELINIRAFDLQRALQYEPDLLDELYETKHDSRIGSVAMKVDGELNNVVFQSWLNQMFSVGESETEEKGDYKDEPHDHSNDDDPNKQHLLRYKGIFAVKGVDKKFLLQGVGMLCEAGFVDVEWKTDEVRESRMVFIGRNLNTAALKEGFESCKASNELRFKVGEEVYANVGKYTKGTILAQWDEGNAYRIRLKRSKREIWAPVDIDEYVKKIS